MVVERGRKARAYDAPRRSFLCGTLHVHPFPTPSRGNESEIMSV